ncbi:MAG: putative transport system permease protein [Actinomycetota bacterium]|jgi:ABC-type lipoprotein release transport system permease subunit
MGAVGVRLRSELRGSWRSWLALALLIGLFNGVVLGVAAGARRTATAFPRFVSESQSSDVLLAAFNTGLDGYYEQLARRPDVEQFALVAGMPIFPASPDGEPVFINGNVVAPINGLFGYTVSRPQILQGRLPSSNRADEVFVNEVAARRLGLQVGKPMAMVAHQPNPDDPDGEEQLTHFEARVTGIGRFVEEIVPTTKFDSEETLLMSEAAYQKWGEGQRLHWDGAFVRLKDPSNLGGFRADAERLAAADPEQTGGEVIFADHIERNHLVERAIAPQALALGLFAAFAGIAGWFVLGQGLARQVADHGSDSPILRVLGLTRNQVFGLTMARAAVTVATAAAVAAVVAVATSSLFPIGAARRAELHTGVKVNVAVLGLGVVAIGMLFLGRAAIPAWRLARRPASLQPVEDTHGGRPTFASRLASSGLTPSGVAGVRMAFEPGRGRTAVPVRTTLVGAVLGLAAVAATVTFGANLDRLTTTPRLYGRAWAATFDGSFGPMPVSRVQPVLDASPVVSRWSGGYYSEATVDGRAVTAIGLRGPVRPPIVEGRAPRADQEIVLGTRTLQAAHRDIGDRVQLVVAGHKQTMTVVGRAVFPALGRGSFPQTGVGEGVLMSAGAAKPPFDPDLAAEIGSGEFFNFFLLDLRADASSGQVAALRSRLLRLCPEDQDCNVVIDPERERPAQIANLDRIRWTPVVLAGLLAVLAVATVGHTLVTSIRRRRRDLALLKTIGFVRGQVSAAIAWQATTIALVAVIVGLPLGLALGRVLWLALAEQMGIVPDVVTPPALLMAAPATILLVNLIGLVPGWLAGRIRPGVALRAE